MALTKLLRNGLGSVLICDGVGVGKTISAGFILAYLTRRLGVPALVVCPPSLPDKWQMELRQKFDLPAVPIRSGEELRLTVDYWNIPNEHPRVFILPSSLLTTIKGLEFSGPVVFDEIHNYRNASTQAWAAAAALCAKSPYRIGLSATPINNGIGDLAAEVAILLNLDIHVAEAIVADVWRPGRQQLSYPLMTRFSKDRLGIHFARREVHDIRVDVSEEYREQVMMVVKAIRGRPQSESIYRDEITYFRLAASSSRAFCKSTGETLSADFSKLAQLKRVLASHEREPVIIFCEFEETARELEEEIDIRSRFVITGSVPAFHREGLLQQFACSKDGVLIMTSVGAEGIDLQFCSTLINYDLNWNPMVLEQRIGRIDRIGQEKPTIRIYNFVVEGSIDDRIIETLGRKLGLVEGSVLEPATVLGTGVRLRAALFTEATLDAELQHARALAQAVELTSTIIPEDYGMLAAVDLAYCDPIAIQDAASVHPDLPWFKDAGEGRDWLRDLDERRDELVRVMDIYSD